MTNPQGTEWETELVNRSVKMGLVARRLVKTGQKGEADVEIGPSMADEFVPVVAWKRLVKTGGQRRKPDGVRDTVTMELEDFLALASMVDEFSPVRFRFWVQAKWTQNLNVTRVLGELKNWMGRGYDPD